MDSLFGTLNRKRVQEARVFDASFQLFGVAIKQYYSEEVEHTFNLRLIETIQNHPLVVASTARGIKCLAEGGVFKCNRLLEVLVKKLDEASPNELIGFGLFLEAMANTCPEILQEGLSDETMLGNIFNLKVRFGSFRFVNFALVIVIHFILQSSGLKSKLKTIILELLRKDQSNETAGNLEFRNTVVTALLKEIESSDENSICDTLGYLDELKVFYSWENSNEVFIKISRLLRNDSRRVIEKSASLQKTPFTEQVCVCTD